MHEQIGEIAGRIWQLLEQRGEANIAQLSKLLKIKSAEAYQAVGWLAREGKIEYIERAGKTFIKHK